jgi:hypothetical protein
MQTRVAIAAHHQQVCTEAAAFCDQHLGNLVFLANRAIFYGIYAVMPEVKHSIIALQRIRSRWMFTFHHEDANFSRVGCGKKIRIPRRENRLAVDRDQCVQRHAM